MSGHGAAPTAWVLTDGKAGDEVQCLGLTEAIGLDAERRRVAPRALFALAHPFGPIDPAEAPDRPGSPLRPPFPDLVVASGRRAVPYLRKVKKASAGRAFTVFLKDPRTGATAADLIWVPEHDRLRGHNVVTTLTPPHRVSQQSLAAARISPDPRLATLPLPRVACLIGGASRHHHFSDDDQRRLLEGLGSLAASGSALMVSASRRTPPALGTAVAALVRASGGFYWNGEGENPYIPMLALADAVLVTADSYNMVGEAVATGVPVLVFEPSGGHPKLHRFLSGLEALGAVHRFRGRLEGERYAPIDATQRLAAVVRDRLTPAPRSAGSRRLVGIRRVVSWLRRGTPAL